MNSLLTWRPGVQTGRYLVRFILLVMAVRLVSDASFRMMYPFLHDYARGLGVTLTAMGGLMMLRTAAMALAPFFGHWADARGARPLLMLGFALQGAGLLVFGYANGVVMAAAGFLTLGLSDAFIYPLIQAYISENAPDRRQGRALISVEYSWAITGIVTLPIFGWLIGGFGWQAPFRVLSIFSGMAILTLLFLLPPGQPRRSVNGPPFLSQLAAIIRDRSALGSVLVYAMVFIAAETYFVTWGAHLAQDFQLSSLRIGQVAAGLGGMELLGSIIASLLVDRVGKRRSVMTGALFFIFALIALIGLNASLWVTLAGMGLIAIAIEYSIVSSIPLMAMQRPANRATVLALGAMVEALVRSFSDPIAAWLLEHHGYLAALAYGFLALAVMLALLWGWVQERNRMFDIR